MTLMTKSHRVVSSVDLGSNFNFAILVLMTLLLASHMEVGSTSTTAGSCMLKNRAMSHNKSSWLRTWLSCCYFMRWHGTTCMQPTDKTRNSVDAFTGWDVWKKSKRETNTRYSSIKHVSSAFGPASGSWTAALEQVKRWLHTVVEVTTLRPLSK